MASLSISAYKSKWGQKFADNEFQHITEGTFREFTDDTADSFVSSATVAVNVPAYSPTFNATGTPPGYPQGYTVTYTINGEDGLYAATHAGQLPAPTSLIGDAHWRRVSPPLAPTVLFQRISQALAIAMDSDAVVFSGREYAVELGAGRYVQLVGGEDGHFPSIGVLHGEQVVVNVHNGYVETTGPEQVSWANLMARFADTPPLPDKLYGITDRPSDDPSVLCRFEDVSNWHPGGVTIGMLVATSAREVGSVLGCRYDLAYDVAIPNTLPLLGTTGTSTTQTMHQLAISNAIQAALNTAPLIVARRDDGSIDTSFTNLRDAVFWAQNNGYGGIGGYVLLNRPLKVLPGKNPLVGQGTILDLQNQPLDLGGGRLDMYGGAVVKNNSRIYNGTVNLRFGGRLGTMIQGGVVAAKIIGETDYSGVPLILDNVIVTDFGQGGSATNATAKIILRNGSTFYQYAPDPAASIVIEPNVDPFDVPLAVRQAVVDGFTAQDAALNPSPCLDGPQPPDSLVPMSFTDPDKGYRYDFAPVAFANGTFTVWTSTRIGR